MIGKSGIHFTFPAALAASRTHSVNGRLSRGLFRNQHYHHPTFFFSTLPSSNDYIPDGNLMLLLRSFCYVIRSIVGIIDESWLTRAPESVFSPRLLIAFMKLVRTGQCSGHQTPRLHPYMSSFSLSALIKDGSSCVHIRHFQTFKHELVHIGLHASLGLARGQCSTILFPCYV
jgi:hypothetical protein